MNISGLKEAKRVSGEGRVGLSGLRASFNSGLRDRVKAYRAQHVATLKWQLPRLNRKSTKYNSQPCKRTRCSRLGNVLLREEGEGRDERITRRWEWECPLIVTRSLIYNVGSSLIIEYGTRCVIS